MTNATPSAPDQAIEILRQTQDGNALAPEHLKLVEMAVNKRLNDKGIVLFESLYDQVISGAYVKPWLCGIEHLTIDTEGWVSWKGIQVEHYNLSWIASEACLKQARVLAQRCRFVEKRGHAVTPSEVGSGWNMHHALNFMAQQGCLFVSDKGTGFSVLYRPHPETLVFGRVHHGRRKDSGHYRIDVLKDPRALGIEPGAECDYVAGRVDGDFEIRDLYLKRRYADEALLAHAEAFFANDGV